MVQLKIIPLDTKELNLDLSKMKSIKGGDIGTLDPISSDFIDRSIPTRPSSIEYDYIGGTTPLFTPTSDLTFGPSGLF